MYQIILIISWNQRPVPSLFPFPLLVGICPLDKHLQTFTHVTSGLSKGRGKVFPHIKLRDKAGKKIGSSTTNCILNNGNAIIISHLPK